VSQSAKTRVGGHLRLASSLCAALTVAVATSAADPASEKQSEVAAALEKVYASVTLDADKNITAVDFSDADYSDKDLTQLRGLPKLDSLVITGSTFNDHSIKNVCGLDRLTQLTLENTSITGAGLEQLRDLPALKSLNVRRNSALTDDGLSGLK